MVENVEDLLRELKYVAKKYENEKLCTFEVSRKRMAEDCIKGITFLQTENAELKKKLCLMRKYIYGNYDLEYKEMQLQHIDEFGTELKVVRNER